MHHNPIATALDSIVSEWKKIRPESSIITFDDLQDFVSAYTIEVDSSYPLHGKAEQHFSPYIFLLHFSVAYNRFLFDMISTRIKGNIIHSRNGSQEYRDNTYELVILQLWKHKDYTADNLARSFCIGHEFESIQQTRIYIENCLLLFLLLTDEKVLKKYINDQMSVDEFKKYWWKHLKPSKISNKIKENRKHVIDQQNKAGMIWPDIRKEAPGDNLNFFMELYERSNDYIHLKKRTVLDHAYESRNNRFRINVTHDWSDHSNQVLLNLIETLTYSTSWLYQALSCHVTIFGPKEKAKEDNELIKFIHDLLVVTCASNGMYEFGNQESNP